MEKKSKLFKTLYWITLIGNPISCILQVGLVLAGVLDPLQGFLNISCGILFLIGVILLGRGRRVGLTDMIVSTVVSGLVGAVTLPSADLAITLPIIALSLALWWWAVTKNGYWETCR